MYYLLGLKRKNSKHYDKTLQDFQTQEEVLHHITKNNLQVLPSPYFFTHIPLSDNTIITQTVNFNNQEVTTTPKTLYTYLTTT